MQRLRDLPADGLERLLSAGELGIIIGPYTYQLQSRLPAISAGLAKLYPDFQLAQPGSFVDYNITVRHSGPAGRLRDRVEFLFDNHNLFGTIETHNAYAFMEWGMNWCVSIHANEYLKLHAAVVAKSGRAVLMPGVPGAGKSTLCAALGLSGWRVLSDEHALIPPGTSEVVPLPRPVSLKNASIPLIQAFSSNAVLGPTSGDTHKGIVAHMKADMAPDSHDTKPLPASTMVFPRYSAEDKQGLFRRSRSQSFILAAYHSFNYSLLGSAGFRAMVTLLDATECYDLVYQDLDWAITKLDHLHDGATG
jgi:HprK-related kinase A